MDEEIKPIEVIEKMNFYLKQDNLMPNIKNLSVKSL
jgi:hypothetical protein